MSFSSDVFDEETFVLSLLNFPGSPEPCIPLTNSLNVETQNMYDGSTGMIHVSPMNEANPLMSSQQSNLRIYQERSTVLPNPLEMQQQHQHHVMQQQQLGNSHETWLQPPPSVLASRQDDLHNLRMVNILDLTYPIQNQINRIPTLNVIPENNISFMLRPQMSLSSIRPQMSSNSIRHHGNMQRSVNQSLLRFRFSTHIRPSANSTIPLPSEVLGSRRRSYQSRFDVGQPSSPAKRRRISRDENVGSTSINPAERRLTNSLYNPLYESLGISMDPHLRKFSEMKMN